MAEKNDICSEFDKLRELQDDLNKKIESAGNKALKAVFKKLFAAFPMLGAIRFSGFTTYFNDGDECHYNIHGVELKILSADPTSASDVLVNESDWLSSYDNEVPSELKEPVRALESALEDIDETIKMIFGDHKRIVVTRKGTDVEDYTDHD